MAANLLVDQATDVQLARFAKLIYDRSGIRVAPQKKTMLSNRLRRRLKARAMHDFDEYLHLLNGLPANHPEWDAFLQEVSTHESYLFRDESHWKWLQTIYLPELVAQARQRKRPRSFRAWSAACSTGDEAFTIAACVASRIADSAAWKIEIVGTDIGVGAIRQAERGEFSGRAMRLVPEDARRRYFVASPDKTMWRAKPALSRSIRFQQHNLLEPFKDRPFDLIVIKNVLIYFDAVAKKRALANVVPLLAPGGSLVTTAAEGISGAIADLVKVKSWLYSRPARSLK
jgi:chemotaxis protein methyltransferase CheR